MGFFDDDEDHDDGVFDSIPLVKLWGKLSENLGKMCCVRPSIDRFTFVGKTQNKIRSDYLTTLYCGAVVSKFVSLSDENANLGTAMRYEEIGEWHVGGT